MPQIKKNLFFLYNNKKYILDANLLYLDTEYMDKYKMTYLTKKFIDTTILPLDIKEIFNPYNMAVQFGSMRNLSCKQTRYIYHQLLDYFTTLFEQKMYELTNIDINNTNDNNEYTCTIAECLSIIRASIRKYSRFRTALNQILCSKDNYEQLNHDHYKCPYPINDDTLCPTFRQSLKKHKTCKKVISKAKTTNGESNIKAEVSILYPFAPQNNTTRKLGVSIPKNNRIKFTSKKNKQTRITKQRKRSQKSKRNITKSIINNTYSIDSVNINT